MLESQRKKLMEWDKPYICIGICRRGDELPVIPIPWTTHSGYMNMKAPPRVWFDPNDFCNPDPEIMARLRQLEVIGCYIYSEMKDYSFLEQFPDIVDLFIAKATALKNLHFMQILKNCRMLFLEKATVDNLDDLVSFHNSSRSRYSFYLALINCQVANIDSICKKDDVLLFELIVASTGEEERWKAVPAMIYTYREK